MELDEVATFVKVVESGSFSGAGELLGVPRSTVSRRIARLEAHLEVRLIERTTRSMSLTEQGHAFYERVAPALCQIDGAGELVRDLAGEPQGTLKLTAPVDFSLALLPAILRDFALKYPKVRVQLEATNRQVDLVGEGFDLAIRAGHLADSSLIAKRIAVTEMWLFASEAYVKAQGEPRTLDALQEHPCLLFGPMSGRWILGTEAGETHVLEVQGALIANEFAVLREALHKGSGITLLPAFWRKDPGLKRILAPWRVKGAPLHLLTPSRKYLPARTRAFQEFLLERLEEEAKGWSGGA